MEWVQIAGTNGKGSTAIYLSEILSQKAECGLFTSPHINTPLERIKINGRQIPENLYNNLFANYKAGGENAKDIGGLFDVWTRMAIDRFTTENVGYAVMETGLGGRRDPTNKVESKTQIITPIDFDHTDYLGDTIRKIAREKCGIIKQDSSVITHPQHTDAMDVIKRTCQRLNCKLTVLDTSKIIIHKSDSKGICFSFAQAGVNLNCLTLKTVGRVQAENACAAALAASALGLDNDAIEAGLRNARIPGRIEVIGNVVLDAAHNPAAVKVLAEIVKRLFPKKHITVLTAVMKDKDVEALSDGIKSFADAVICTRADRQRGLPSKEYCTFFDNANAYENPIYAFEYAKEVSAKKGGIIVVCGSFYLLPYIYGLIEL